MFAESADKGEKETVDFFVIDQPLILKKSLICTRKNSIKNDI